MWAPGSCPVSDNATAAGLEAASACLACVLLKWRAIEADPRFPAALKKLQALGFTLDGTLADTMGVYQCVASNDSALRPGRHGRLFSARRIGRRPSKLDRLERTDPEEGDGCLGERNDASGPEELSVSTIVALFFLPLVSKVLRGPRRGRSGHSCDSELRQRTGFERS